MNNIPYDPSVDLLVGMRLRDIRLLHDYSQSMLARQLDVTFQQIQKYETGTSRMSAGRLYAAAHVFRTPMEDFCRPTFPRDPLAESFAWLERALAEVQYHATVREPLSVREAVRMRPHVQEIEGRVAALAKQLADLGHFLDVRCAQ